MRPTILLFDIDGTLIHGGGAGKRALQRAFERLYGRSDWLDFPLGGMTDLLIVRQALERGGRQGDPVEPVLERYVELLREEIPASPRYETCPGVVPLLERLSGAARLALGLGTGNVEAGARIKLERLDLNRYFAFGGFGSDHAERAELLRIGAARGAARLGVPPRRLPRGGHRRHAAGRGGGPDHRRGVHRRGHRELRRRSARGGGGDPGLRGPGAGRRGGRAARAYPSPVDANRRYSARESSRTAVALPKASSSVA